MVDLFDLLLGLDQWTSVVVFLLMFLLQTLLVTFPTYVLLFYGGLRFGVWWGIIINMTGMILTTTLGYILGRLGKMENIMRHPSMERFKQQVDERGILAVGFLRVIPILPYNVTSIGSGMLKLDWSKYTLVNLISIFPYVVIWAVLGDFFGDALLSRISLELSWNLLIPSVIFLTLLIIVVRYLRTKYGGEIADHQIKSVEAAD